MRRVRVKTRARRSGLVTISQGRPSDVRNNSTRIPQSSKALAKLIKGRLTLIGMASLGPLPGPTCSLRNEVWMTVLRWDLQHEKGGDQRCH